VIPLRPRSLTLLRYLVAHAGRLVTKAEVHEHVWAGTHVSASVLRASVQEIRKALGDAAGAPRYLETVDRQGYRFLGGGDRERWGQAHDHEVYIGTDRVARARKG
jgi:DNA-binding winged helix-turn-helix (wHTH) protein